MSNAFLVGKKTVLRPISLSDIPLLTKWMNDPETRHNLTMRFPISELSEKKWVEKSSSSDPIPQSLVFAMETKEGEHIGTMGLREISWIDRSASTGTVIGEPQFRGKGYGTDAKMLLLQYAFETLGLHKIISNAFARNTASIAYSKSCGYVVEATLKEEIFRDGNWLDVVRLACFYPAWKEAFQAYQKKQL